MLLTYAHIFIRSDKSLLTHSSLKRNALRKTLWCLSAILDIVYTLCVLQSLRHNENILHQDPCSNVSRFFYQILNIRQIFRCKCNELSVVIM